MRTHYDNLKVSQEAPVEVIQAAYRTLAKKYHPDLNRDNPDAEKIMQILNEAYEVLSDPVREGANKQVISSQADSLIKISRIWADFFPANTSNQPI
nr:J domain-containing protein [Enterobacter hormaechei]